MKWLVILYVTVVFLFMFGCTDNGSNNEIEITSDSATTLDDFNDNNSQNVLGRVFGTYKVNQGMAGADVSWGGGDWYGYASDNGAKIISSDNDTLLDSAGTVVDDPAQIVKLMSDGKLYVILNCQGCIGEYWAGVGCDLVGDYQHPYIYDTLKVINHSAVYWDFSSLDSIRITMSGMGAALFFLESRAVKDKYTDPSLAWGFHGFSHDFDDIQMSPMATYSFAAADFKTDPGSAAADVTWDQAKTQISAFVFELDAELDDRLEIEIDKIEFIGLDTTVVFPFLK
jgi:hypothetical protein